jgi:hypothetical protein
MASSASGSGRARAAPGGEVGSVSGAVQAARAMPVAQVLQAVLTPADCRICIRHALSMAAATRSAAV